MSHNKYNYLTFGSHGCQYDGRVMENLLCTNYGWIFNNEARRGENVFSGVFKSCEPVY